MKYFFLFAEYLLTPDPDLRPDIFQAAYLAFQLQGVKSPIQNLNVRKENSHKYC
jgi:hypothetical protein